jgi:hypothetical protein
MGSTGDAVPDPCVRSPQRRLSSETVLSLLNTRADIFVIDQARVREFLKQSPLRHRASILDFSVHQRTSIRPRSETIQLQHDRVELRSKFGGLREPSQISEAGLPHFSGIDRRPTSSGRTSRRRTQ